MLEYKTMKERQPPSIHENESKTEPTLAKDRLAAAFAEKFPSPQANYETVVDIMPDFDGVVMSGKELTGVSLEAVTQMRIAYDKPWRVGVSSEPQGPVSVNNLEVPVDSEVNGDAILFTRIGNCNAFLVLRKNGKDNSDGYRLHNHPDDADNDEIWVDTNTIYGALSDVGIDAPKATSDPAQLQVEVFALLEQSPEWFRSETITVPVALEDKFSQDWEITRKTRIEREPIHAQHTSIVQSNKARKADIQNPLAVEPQRDTIYEEQCIATLRTVQPASTEYMRIIQNYDGDQTAPPTIEHWFETRAPKDADENDPRVYPSADGTLVHRTGYVQFEPTEEQTQAIIDRIANLE